MGSIIQVLFHYYSIDETYGGISYHSPREMAASSAKHIMCEYIYYCPY